MNCVRNIAKSYSIYLKNQNWSLNNSRLTEEFENVCFKIRYIYQINTKVKRIQFRRDSNGNTVWPIGHDYYPLILDTYNT